MKDSLIQISIDEREELLVNPIINLSAILEKNERKIVYISSSRRYIEVMPKMYVLPVFLPEIGMLLSLDIKSKNLAKEFYEETKDFDGIISKGKLFTSNVYNFDPQVNRMVSWGNVRSFNLTEDIYQLYLSNLVNDLVLTHSIITSGRLISHNRWFYLASSKYYNFQTFLNYNVAIVYLQKDCLSMRKVKRIWINTPLELYEVEAGFIIFQPNGHLRYIEPIFLHFLTDPLENELVTSDKGDYFLCFLISLNDYSTSYEKADIKKGCINIVDTLTKLIFSPWDILPFLFPFLINQQKLSSLIFEFQIGKDVFLQFQKRLMKFGVPQNPEVIDAYESFIEQKNKAMKIIEAENAYTLKIVNPLVIPFLVKKIYNPKIESSERDLAEKLLRAPDFLNKIEELDKHFSEKVWWHFEDFRPLLGIRFLLGYREELLQKYVTIYQKFNRINDF